MRGRDPFGCHVHTGRELGMMLRGEKPLAVFADLLDCFSPVLLRYLRAFDRHAESGRFERREYIQLDRSPRGRMRIVLYALPDHAWRIDAMIELRHTEGWTVASERREGELLGYEDWQNDLWIARQCPAP